MTNAVTAPRPLRAATSERFHHIVALATETFSDRGYRRTRMGDVAGAAGVTDAALYRYFESKEALFATVLRTTLSGKTEPTQLPIPTTAEETTLAYVEGVLSANSQLPILTHLISVHQGDPVAAVGELEQLVRSAIVLTQSLRSGTRLLNACALDWPKFAEIWDRHARRRSIEQFAQYLGSRMDTGALRCTVSPENAARGIVSQIVGAVVYPDLVGWGAADDAVGTIVAQILGAYTWRD